MNLKSIKLTNYRNHKGLNLDFTDNINLITGPNGAGKTNILEAINILSTAKSYKARYDKDLIYYDEPFAKILAKINGDGETTSIELTIAKSEGNDNRSSKKYKINNTPKALYLVSQEFNTVLFSPEDIDFVTGSPNLRRKYINLTLWQIDLKYKKYLLLYHKVMKQRNKLLESINEYKTGMDQLPFWNGKLLEYGEYIQQKREEYVFFINNYLAKTGNEHINSTRQLSFEYNVNSINTERLSYYKDKEIMAKTSLVGPHRDDFTIYQNFKNISEFGSRGEQRTAIFLIKVGEIEFFVSKTGRKPILLLDDIFSELDESHQRLILKMVTGQQTIISSTHKKEFSGFKADNIINI